MEPKEVLLRYLDRAREAMLWKLDGLSEYDVRRPMTPTGTNLLGLVKHLASIELGYLGEVMGRPCGIPMPWFDEGQPPNADLYATADETREQFIELYYSAGRHTAATVAALDLDALKARLAAAVAARHTVKAIARLASVNDSGVIQWRKGATGLGPTVAGKLDVALTTLGH